MRALLAAMACLTASPAWATVNGPFAVNTSLHILYGPVPVDTGTPSGGGTYTSGNQFEACIPAPTGSQNTGLKPVMMLAHGGGLYSGDAHDDGDYECKAWASYGFATFNIDYRELLAPSGTSSGYPRNINFWPAPVVDIQLAIRYACANATTYHADCKNVWFKGDSSGGTLTGDAAFLPTILQSSGDPGTTTLTTTAYSVVGWIDEFGPTIASTPNNSGRTPYTADIVQQNWARVQTVMIVQGTGDTSVPPLASTTVRDTLRSHCVVARYITYKGTASGVGGGHEFTPANAITPTQETIRTHELQFGTQYMHAHGFSWMTSPVDD